MKVDSEAKAPARKKERIEKPPVDLKTEMACWYVMYANEENAAKDKCSYTRYNYFQRVSFKQRSDGKSPGYLDKALTRPLTKRHAMMDKEIYVCRKHKCIDESRYIL